MTLPKPYLANLASEKLALNGPLITILFVGVVTNLGRIRCPSKFAGEALTRHLEMLTKAGIRLMENIDMTEIVQKKVYEFCLFAAPLKIKGGLVLQYACWR
jgi:hypothetical protein